VKIDAENPLIVNPNLGFYKILRGRDNPSTAERLDFINLLCRSTDLKCTDERDRIYGLMLLTQGWQEGNLIANYSLTVSEVFREAMISYLQNYGSILFLEHTYFSYENFEDIKDRTPSWIPDWRKRPLKNIFDGSTLEIKRKREYPLVAHIFWKHLVHCGYQDNEGSAVLRQLIKS
jgi:hypothetical protein